MKLLTALLALSLTACVTNPSTPPCTSRACMQCTYESEAATQNVDTSYRSMFGQALDQAMRAKRLFDMCMAAKG